MNLEIHEAAAAEIRHHFDWYCERNPRVADRLADLFEATVIRILEAPDEFSLMEMRKNPDNIRRARLKGFPLYILYRVAKQRVQILAVPHTAQQPGYWKSRLHE